MAGNKDPNPYTGLLTFFGIFLALSLVTYAVAFAEAWFHFKLFGH